MKKIYYILLFLVIASNLYSQELLDSTIYIKQNIKIVTNIVQPTKKLFCNNDVIKMEIIASVNNNFIPNTINLKSIGINIINVTSWEKLNNSIFKCYCYFTFTNTIDIFNQHYIYLDNILFNNKHIDFNKILVLFKDEDLNNNPN